MDFTRSRYRDKAYLVTYELTTDIFNSFNIKVDDIIPIRSVYILHTDKGVKMLEKIDYSLEELEFINYVISHVTSNGFKNVVPFVETAEGGYYIKRDDGIYIMYDLMESREIDYTNLDDISLVSKTLCSFHQATSGIEYVIDKKNNLHKWIPNFKRRADNLLKFKEIASMHEIKTDFDEVFLENVDKHYEQASKSIELLENSAYDVLCSEAGKFKNICHHDLARHNIIMGSDGEVYFLGLDSCILDLRIHDIANLIVKTIKYYNWDFERAKNIIKSYSSVSPIKEEELTALYGFLTFPHDFYEISRQYYMQTKKWDNDEFLARLIRKSGYYDDRNTFLEKFKNEIIA